MNPFPQDNRPLAMLHIGKTGGTTLSGCPHVNYFGHVACVEPGDVQQNFIYHKHDLCRERCMTVPLELVRRYYCFTIVRHPLSWLVSYADWCGCWHDWNTTHYDYLNARRGFDYLMRVIMERQDQWPSRRLLFCQLFTPSGAWVPDAVLHTEALDEEFQQLLQSRGLTWSSQERLKRGQSHVRKIRPSVREAFHDKRLLSDVLDSRQNEFRLLGYQNTVDDMMPCDNPRSGHVTDASAVYSFIFNQLTL